MSKESETERLGVIKFIIDKSDIFEVSDEKSKLFSTDTNPSKSLEIELLRTFLIFSLINFSSEPEMMISNKFIKRVDIIKIHIEFNISSKINW